MTLGDRWDADGGHPFPKGKEVSRPDKRKRCCSRLSLVTAQVRDTLSRYSFGRQPRGQPTRDAIAEQRAEVRRSCATEGSNNSAQTWTIRDTTSHIRIETSDALVERGRRRDPQRSSERSPRRGRRALGRTSQRVVPMDRLLMRLSRPKGKEKKGSNRGNKG